MAVRVIDLLEMVHVQEHQGHGAIAAFAARHGLLEFFLELTAVRQTGQRIDVGQLAELHLHLLGRRHVGAQGVDAGHMAIRLHIGDVDGVKVAVDSQRH